MLVMLADYRLYLLLGAAFVAGYARTADDRAERDRGPKGRLGSAADLLFLAAFPLLGLLFWRHGILAGAASLLGAWVVALVGDLVYQRHHTPPVQRPRTHHAFDRVEQMSCLLSVGASRVAGRVAPPRFPGAQFPRHVRYRRSASMGRGVSPRY